MKLGLKVNADADSFDRLSKANPLFVEVWYNANDPGKYRDMFDELKQRHCEVGLHFWGMLDHQMLPNIAYPDREIQNASIHLIRQTIDQAALHGFQYVNIHPGSSALLQVDYEMQRYDLVHEPTDVGQSMDLFVETAKQLADYATQHNIVLTVETVPSRITDGWYTEDARLHPKNVYELPVEALFRAADLGISVANDFCHTAANVISTDPYAIYTYLYGVTKKLAPQTRLIHAGFVMPPYNGTDNHDHFANPIFQSDHAVPNVTQTIELLQQFVHRDDVWILAEPKNDHVGNYELLRQMIENASTFT